MTLWASPAMKSFFTRRYVIHFVNESGERFAKVSFTKEEFKLLERAALGRGLQLEQFFTEAIESLVEENNS